MIKYCDKVCARSGKNLFYSIMNSTVQILFHFLWDHWAYCGIFENGVRLMYILEGVSNVANFITAYEVSQFYRDSHFLICGVFFVSKGNIFVAY